jgi:hypothetical protein
LVGEQGLHLVAAVLAWRQTDGVDHQQVDASARRSRPEVGRVQPLRWRVPALLPVGRGGGVSFQIEDEDDFMCPYEQTQASNYFNCDMKNKLNRVDEDALSDIFSDDCCDTEAGSPPFNG